MSVVQRNNVRTFGSGDHVLVFAHGFGCDQSMWKFVAPAFEESHRVVLFDLTGAGQSDLSAYDYAAYGKLERHAEDIIEICDALELEKPTLVGHSVSAITSGLAAVAAPDKIGSVVMVAPSPCFLNQPEYTGGFDRADLEQVIDFMQQNYLGWAEQMAPTIAGDGAEGPASQMLTQSFCRTDPDIARHFGEVTFLSDKRAEMSQIDVPTLILQCANDALAPTSVGEWMEKTIPNATLNVIDTFGHCPHLTAPDATIQAIESYLSREQATR